MTSTAPNIDFPELLSVIESLRSQARITFAHKNFLWLHVFEAYEQGIAAGRSERSLKIAILETLQLQAPFLASSSSAPRNALRMTWQRKYERWLSGGRKLAALDDARDCRRIIPEPTERDWAVLTVYAANHGGGIEQAWRECFSRLSQPIQDYHQGNRHCPRRIRKRIEQRVKDERKALHGPKAMRSAGAYVDRDPSGIASGDWDQSDDMTMVNLWWEDTPDGLFFGQGQLLAWIDERSWFIYGFTLISDRAYSGFSIRNSWTAKAAHWNLPRQGLSLERGIWRTSRVLVGRSREVDPLETEMGIRRLNLRLHHFTHARGKVIERAYGLLQNDLQAQPGYVGRNPLTDKYEEVQKQRLAVERGAHPSRFFLSKAEWGPILDSICLKFNDTPMHGKYHEGCSPRQIYESCFTTKLQPVPHEFRYLLASNRIETTVGGNGVTFRFGNRTFIYKGRETGRLRGQRIVAWFNSERPETLACTDLNAENPFLLDRATSVFPHDPLPGTLEKAQAENAAHNRYEKEEHRSLKRYYQEPFFNNLSRPTFVDPASLETAREINRLESEAEAKRQAESRIFRGNRSAAAGLNMTLPATAQRGRETAKAIKGVAEFLAADDSEVGE